MSIPSPRGMLSRDSCLQRDTLNSFGIPAAFFGNSRNSASAQCEPVSLNTGRLADPANELERNTRNFATPTPRFARKFSA